MKNAGKFWYFGTRWCSHTEAHDKYLAQLEPIRNGVAPRECARGETVAESCNRFLNDRRAQQPLLRNQLITKPKRWRPEVFVSFSRTPISRRRDGRAVTWAR